MDSLTQIVLGAAVGEAVLGRKVGNRAMLWGGLAGTLPDLDVLSGMVTDPMSALAYHRAFTHSFVFAVLAAPLIGLTVHRMYGGRSFSGLCDRLFYPVNLLLFWLLLLVGSYLMPVEVFDIPRITAVITGVFASLVTLVGLFALRKQRRSGVLPANVSGTQWTLLFFLAIVTHPLLDCFTVYGTQFLQPISSLRIAWSTISVVDPLYTLPFLLLLLFAARFGRATRVRHRLNRVGLYLSSAYLLLTVINHFHTAGILRESTARAGIVAERGVHGPTLGNNLLWSATVQSGGDTYHLGQYSLLDTDRRFKPLIPVQGRHVLLQPYAGDRELEIIKWFSDGYYTVTPVDSSLVRISDLRYGMLGEDPDDPAAFLFQWTVDTSVRPVRVVEQQSGPREDGSKMLSDLWERMGGI